MSIEMFKFPTLYKLDSKGKIRSLVVELEGNKYRTISGIIDGAKITTDWTYCIGKNKGKANATTDEEQAKSEANALVVKKLKEKYVTNISDVHISSESFFNPMLAYTIEAAKFDVEKWLNIHSEGLIIDPKLDGQRMVTTATNHLSRKGRNIPAANNIALSLAKFFENHPNIVLDGELYNHSYCEDFQGLMSLTRKTDITDDDWVIIDRDLEYHLYDIKDLDKPNMNAFMRKQLLDSFKSEFVNTKVHVVDWRMANRIEGYKALLDKNLADGYEGSIIRLPRSIYENKRSKNLLKVKLFEDAEFTIVDILPGVGNRTSMAGSIKVIDYITKIEFNAGIKGSWEYATSLLINKDNYIGLKATIKFFGKSNEGVPRFPILIDIDRDDL